MNAVTAHVDLAALRRNVSTIRGLCDPAAVCAVVKADGYGHGAIDVAEAAIDAGATWLGVATAAEAVELADLADPASSAGQPDLREQPVPILVLSERPESELRELWPRLPRGIRLVIASETGARLVDSLTVRPVPVHMKVDTGMHRMGVDPADAAALADLVAALPGTQLEGVCTHLAVADELSNDFTTTQIRRFDGVLADLDSAGHRPAIVHMANSAAAITRPETRLDMIRLGIAMYGVEPSAELSGAVELSPVLRMTTEVSAVRIVQPSESVSYGRHWFADGPARIATLPIGYADGLRRASAAAGVEVLIGGRRRPIVGVVTMDQAMVLVDDTVSAGDEVVLVGEQGSETITVSEIAGCLDTISYEVLVSIGSRVMRRATR